MDLMGEYGAFSVFMVLLVHTLLYINVVDKSIICFIYINVDK